MKIPRCKGARDHMPEDMRKYRRIKQAFRSSCESWGYDEIRTPTIEYMHLFTSTGTLTPEMLSRVYSFLDWDGWSGERVVLRPDGTIPVARLYVENMADKPLTRLYYIENMFSFEGTGQESRERWQCGVELIGGAEPQGDAELIVLAIEILNKLNIAPINVKISHVGMSKALLENLGVRDHEKEELLRRILAGDTSVFEQIEKPSSDIARFLKLLRNLQGKSLGSLANLKSVLPKDLNSISSYMDDMAQIAGLLDSIGQDYQIDFTAGEGFEYYTGMVFQFYYNDVLLGNGGRYDELIPLVGGGNVPASGFAIVADRLLPLIDEESLPVVNRVLITSKAGNDGAIKKLFEVASLLRDRDFAIEIDMGTKCATNCRWTVTLEEEEELSLTLTDGKNRKSISGLSFDQLLLKFEGEN